MRCLVTGAAGFIGSTLVDRLLQDGHQVIGIDCFLDYYPKAAKLRNIEPARANQGYSFIEANLLDARLDEILRGVDVVFHQAAQAGVRASWGKDFTVYTDNNIRATQHLLESALRPEVRKTLKKIVFASSSSVYGDAESLPTSETTCPQPVSPYGVTKLAAEHLMSLYANEHALLTVSLRYFTVYGPRQRPDMAFHRFIRAALSGDAIQVYGDGTQTRDFTFVSDIIEANILAATRSNIAGVYNIGGGARVGLGEVISILGDILGEPLKIHYESRQAGDARHTGADITRAVRELGYSPKTKLAEGLKQEATWLQSLGENVR